MSTAKTKLKSGPGIVIGLPTLGRPVPLEWALAFKSLNPPINFNTVFQIVNNQEVGVARQAIAEYAVEQDAKYLFFIGDDVIVPAHALRQLIFRMEHDPNLVVVGGIYCSKSDPAYPLVFRGNGAGTYWDWKVGEFFEITGIGMDCTLIKVDALRTIPKPWFKTVDTDSFMDGRNAAENWTEDLYFCTKVVEGGHGKIYADATVICKHADVYGGRVYELPANSLPMRRRSAPPEMKRCLMINQTVDIAEKADFEVVTFGFEGADYRGDATSLPFKDNEFDWVLFSTNKEYSVAIEECRRVIKTDGKVTVHLSPHLSKSFFLENVPRSKPDGQFLQVTK